MTKEEEEKLKKEWAWIEDIDRDRYNEARLLEQTIKSQNGEN